MSTRTIVTVQLEVHDAQPYGNEMTAAKIQKQAAESALRQIACLNSSGMRIVGAPKVTLVIAEES